MAHEFNDAKGRPIVAVTGMGLVTSLGRGKADNWAALAAGRSGIRRITRFPTEGMRTTIAGCVDFMDVEPFSAPALTMAMAEAAAQEALAQSGFKDTAVPGPLYVATPPAELEWPQRKALFERATSADVSGYPKLLAAARSGAFRDMFATFQFASVAEHLAERFGTRGMPVSVSTACASGAYRHPARRGSHSPRRDDNCALRRHRQLRTA